MVSPILENYEKMFWPENEKAEVSFWAIVAFSFQIYCQFHAIERFKMRQFLILKWNKSCQQTRTKHFLLFITIYLIK